MAQTYPKNFKNCAVCNFWGGSRQVDNFGLKTTVSSARSLSDWEIDGGEGQGLLTIEEKSIKPRRHGTKTSRHNVKIRVLEQKPPPVSAAE